MPCNFRFEPRLGDQIGEEAQLDADFHDSQPGPRHRFGGQKREVEAHLVPPQNVSAITK